MNHKERKDMTFFGKMIRRFARDEGGNLVVEAVLVLPIMLWAYAAMFVYWDAYQSINTVQKAAYTVTDLVTRQQGSVDDSFIDGMRGTMDYLIETPGAAKMRVTSFRWSEANDRYEVIWSRSPGSALTQLTTSSIAALTAKLPTMSDGDSAVLVEANVNYTPPMRFGLEPNVINQFVVSRPRYLPKICHVDVNCG